MAPRRWRTGGRRPPASVALAGVVDPAHDHVERAAGGQVGRDAPPPALAGSAVTSTPPIAGAPCTCSSIAPRQPARSQKQRAPGRRRARAASRLLAGDAAQAEVTQRARRVAQSWPVWSSLTPVAVTNTLLRHATSYAHATCPRRPAGSRPRPRRRPGCGSRPAASGPARAGPDAPSSGWLWRPATAGRAPRPPSRPPPRTSRPCADAGLRRRPAAPGPAAERVQVPDQRQLAGLLLGDRRVPVGVLRASGRPAGRTGRRGRSAGSAAGRRRPAPVAPRRARTPTESARERVVAGDEVRPQRGHVVDRAHRQPLPGAGRGRPARRRAARRPRTARVPPVPTRYCSAYCPAGRPAPAGRAATGRASSTSSASGPSASASTSSSSVVSTMLVVYVWFQARPVKVSAPHAACRAGRGQPQRRAGLVGGVLRR